MSSSRALTNKSSFHTELPESTMWKDFLALIKIGIVNSNSITTFTGLWLAIYFLKLSFIEHIDTILFTLIGSSFIIAGSCAINNYIDRDIDHLMERTKSRPTVTGKITPIKVAILGYSLIIIGIGLLLFTSFTATLIGIIGVFSYVVIYTKWAKRHFVSNTVIGSIAGAVPPLIGWAAVDPNLDMIAWALFLLMFVWQPPHFYALAMRRVDEYRAAGIPMLPVIKGLKTTKKHIYFWVVALLPIPFLLSSLGIFFIIIATLLNIGWIITGIYAEKFKDEFKWATLMFVYSLQYLTIIFLAMIIATFI